MISQTFQCLLLFSENVPSYVTSAKVLSRRSGDSTGFRLRIIAAQQIALSLSLFFLFSLFFYFVFSFVSEVSVQLSESSANMGLYSVSSL